MHDSDDARRGTFAGPMGVLAAMGVEAEGLVAAMPDAAAIADGVTAGTLMGVPAVVATCGVGKARAAAATQRLIDMGASMVVNTGVAGSLTPGLGVGDVLVSSDLVDRDMDVTALGYLPGQTPGEETVEVPASPALVALALEAAEDVASRDGVRARAGRVLTGDSFVADAGARTALREAFGGDCCEMEGAAAARVASDAGVPFVAVRVISDEPGGTSPVAYAELEPVAAARAAEVVMLMAAILPDALA